MNNLSASANTLSAQQEEFYNDAIDIREVIGIVLGSWPIIAVALTFALLIGQYTIFVTPPTYETDALVQVESTPTIAEAAIGELQQNFAPEMYDEAEVELLKSRSTLKPVIERLRLDILAKPKTFQLLGQPLGDSVFRRFTSDGYGLAPMWLRAFDDGSYAWGGESITVTRLQVPDRLVNTSLEIITGENGSFTASLPDESASAVGKVGEEVRIKGEHLGNADSDVVLFIQEINAMPGTGFTLKKIPMHEAIADIQASFNAQESSARGIISLRFVGETPRQIVRTLDSILRTYQVQHIERRSELAQQTLEFLGAQLPTLRERVEVAEARLNQYRIERGTADLDRETAALLEQNLTIEQQLSELRQRKQEALQRFTQRHPIIVSIDSQIQELDGQLSKIDDRVSELPDVQQQVLALIREVEVATTLYTALLNRKQEFEMVRAGTTGSIRIIDTPMLPRIPIAPNAVRTFMICCLLGLIFGITVVLSLFYLKTGVDDPSKVESRLNLSNYGSIPYSVLQKRINTDPQSENSAQTRLVTLLEPMSTTSEAIRSLRTALRFAQFDAPNNITMITSPSPRVGKSFVSLNLGALIAQTGDRVLVIDADMRRGQINKSVGVARTPGLSEVITNEASLEAAVHRTSVEGLYVLPTGSIPPNPSELIINDRFIDVLQTLSEQFSHVIVDTPPILAVTDAADIGRHCGTTLVALKSGEHSMAMIEDTINRLHRSGVRVRGTVFNQVGRKSRIGYRYGYGQYGSYYYSGYRYAYGNPSNKMLEKLASLLGRKAKPNDQ